MKMIMFEFVCCRLFRTSAKNQFITEKNLKTRVGEGVRVKMNIRKLWKSYTYIDIYTLDSMSGCISLYTILYK